MNTFLDNNVASNLNITDFNDNYRVYHYNNNASGGLTNNNSTSGGLTNSETDNPDFSLLERGVIRDTKGNIVCKSFSFTPEYFSDQKSQISKLIGNGRVSDNFKFYKAEEVTMIRAWFHDNRWRISTHKKLDAYNSRWGSQKSYGELFCEAIHYYVQHGELRDKILYELEEDIMDCFFASLRTDRVYAFILRTNSDNRIVCNAPSHPTLYLAGEFDTTNEFKYIEENTSGISRPTELFFSDIDSLYNYLDNTDPTKYQGIMAYYFNGKGELEKTFKFTNKSYEELYLIRGNCPSVGVRYLQLRNDPLKIMHLIDMYPEYKEYFMLIENYILHIINNIYSAYVTRYINKQYIQIPKEQYLVMNELHKYYLQDKTQNKITYDLVSTYINNIDTVKLTSLMTH